MSAKTETLISAVNVRRRRTCARVTRVIGLRGYDSLRQGATAKPGRASSVLGQRHPRYTRFEPEDAGSRAGRQPEALPDGEVHPEQLRPPAARRAERDARGEVQVISARDDAERAVRMHLADRVLQVHLDERAPVA